jgi:tetratricopeptide (TPR) repeat protein
MRIILFTLALGGANATAQTDEARALAKRGIEHFYRGDYELALQDFEASYAQRPVTELLFNMAQAHRLNGNCDKALDHYQRYMELAPHGRLRSEVATRIAEMKLCSATALAPQPSTPRPLAAPSDPTPPPPQVAIDADSTPVRIASPESTIAPQLPLVPSTLVTAPPAKRPLVKRPWFWITMGSTAVVLATGIALGLDYGVVHDPTPNLRVPGNSK